MKIIIEIPGIYFRCNDDALQKKCVLYQICKFSMPEEDVSLDDFPLTVSDQFWRPKWFQITF